MMPDQLGRVFLYGRLRGLPRAALSTMMVNANARLVRDSGSADTVVVARAALSACLAPDGALTLPFAVPPGARLLSEGALRHRFGGVAPDGAPEPGPYTFADVSRLAGLPMDACRALALFDVIGPGWDRFGYRDLAVARQVARLLRDGSAPRAVIESAWALGARGVRLSEVRLVEAPWGEVVQQVGPQIARLDGQFALLLEETASGVEASLAQALASEEDGALEEAERWYRRAAQADRRDPFVSFNLGNVLVALGRDAEATIAFQQALAVDPAFAEAAFNLAGLYEKIGQEDRALALYAETVAAHPAYAQAIYNAARLLTLRRRFAEALPLWERFVALVPGDADVGHARRGALLCRMEQRRGTGRA